MTRLLGFVMAGRDRFAAVPAMRSALAEPAWRRPGRAIRGRAPGALSWLGQPDELARAAPEPRRDRCGSPHGDHPPRLSPPWRGAGQCRPAAGRAVVVMAGV